MRKTKTYIIDLFDSLHPSARVINKVQDAEFWSSDTDAWLNFGVTSQSFTVDSAEINLYNKNDKTLLVKPMIVVNNEAQFEMVPNIISHFGEWSAQVIFKSGGKSHTSPTVRFTVSRRLGDDLPERLGLIEDWKYLSGEVKSFVAEIEGFTLDQFVELKIGEELARLEDDYVTRLTELESNDVNFATQLNQTEIDVANWGGEIIEARDEEATLEDRLSRDTSLITSEISERGFNLDSLVGEDGVITTAMFNEAVASRQFTIFLKRNRTYYINETITLGNNILEGNNANIVANNCDGFLANNGDYLHIVPRIQNLTLRYEGSGSHRGIVARRGWWGSRVRVDNVRVSGFSIGVLGLDIYHSTFRDVWISECTIGLAITNHNDLSNMNDVSQVDFRDCTYGMYLHEAESMRVFSTTFQECVYGLVIGDSRANVEFDNCYFEYNEYDTTLGTINLETFVLSEYTLSVSGVIGAGVNFSGSTVIKALSPPYFFGENHKFISRYGNYDTNGYPDNIDNLFTSGIEYENIIQDRWGFYKGATDTGVMSRAVTDTQYGKKYVAQIDGATGTNIRALSNVMTPLVIGRTYMIKAKVWSPEPMRITFNIVRDNADTIATGRVFTTLNGGWVDASTMITITGGVGSDQQLMISFPTISKASKLLVTDIMMVDLTTLFGSDNTPGHYMAKIISKYFNWAPTGERVKVAYGSAGVKSFTTANRPKHPIKGETGFDTTLSKPIWCSVEAVMNTSGVITSASKWVDSSGTIV